MRDTIDGNRRRLLSAAAMTLAAAQLAPIGTSKAKAATTPAASFAPLKRVATDLLDLAYAEAGPADGPPVILLHGWPYDIHTYVDVAPLLAARGHRVIVPYLRGYGATRFLSADTLRNGQPAALALDAVALMDALRIDRAILGGCDWGARTADIVAALWPERVKGLVAVSGYLIGSQQAGCSRCRRRPSCNGGINSISQPNAVGSATKRTAAHSRN